MDPQLVRFEGFEGIHLVADRWGAADAWPVLLMHGGGQTRHAWGNTASVLADHGWQAVSLDLRGHGDSEWAADGATGRGNFSSSKFESGAVGNGQLRRNAKLRRAHGATRAGIGDDRRRNIRSIYACAGRSLQH